MEKELKLFSQIFADFPNLAILHIDNNLKFINKTVEKIVSNSNGKLHFIDLTKDDIKKVKPNPREYEYIILCDIQDKLDDNQKFYNLMYRSLENSGNIVVLEKTSDITRVDEIKSLLDKSQFVAINDINLFDGYILVTAKKMHMWGNGL